MTPEDVCLAMIAKSSDEDFKAAIESAAPYVSQMVIVVAPHDPLLKFRFDRVNYSDGLSHDNGLPRNPIKWIVQEWDGYSKARNRAIEEAEKFRPWVLTLDTGDRLEGSGMLPTYERTANAEKRIDAFDMKVVMIDKDAKPSCSFYRPHLVRSSCHWRFQLRVHECLIPPTSDPMIERWNGLTYFSQVGSTEPAELNKRIALMLQDLEDGTAPLRTLFYLGRTYEALQQWGKAIEAHRQRLDMTIKPDEESFWSELGIARASLMLGYSPDVCIELFRALARRYCNRAEPIRHLARLYQLQADNATAYADRLPVPDVRFTVELDAYSQGQK
jgi:hypothetical protein